MLFVWIKAAYLQPLLFRFHHVFLLDGVGSTAHCGAKMVGKATRNVYEGVMMIYIVMDGHIMRGGWRVIVAVDGPKTLALSIYTIISISTP